MIDLRYHFFFLSFFLLGYDLFTFSNLISWQKLMCSVSTVERTNYTVVFFDNSDMYRFLKWILLKIFFLILDATIVIVSNKEKNLQKIILKTTIKKTWKVCQNCQKK